MSMYFRGGGNSDRGVKKSTFQIVVIVAGALALACIILLVTMSSGTTADTQVEDVLAAQARAQEGLARETAAQISRIGGSATMQLLAKTRQHLYALSQLNELAVALIGPGVQLTPQQSVNTAIATLDTCENRFLAGQSIETELTTLWEQLGVIATEAGAL